MDFSLLTLPSDCHDAIWMKHPTEGKDWIISKDHRSIFTLWQNENGTQSRRVREIDWPYWNQKLSEKLDKGYQEYARFSPNFLKWVHTGSGIYLAPPNPDLPDLLRIRASREVEFANGSQYVNLLLTTDLVLYHYEWQGNDDYHRTTPLWQTVFSSYEEADLAMNKVAAQRLKIGFRVKRDKLFDTLPPPSSLDWGLAKDVVWF